MSKEGYIFKISIYSKIYNNNNIIIIKNLKIIVINYT